MASELSYRRTSKQLRSCDFCRIARQKCFREHEGQKCTGCIKNNYICSPSRTAEQFRFLLYGPNGLMLDPKYREDGLRDMSETAFFELKVAQERNSSTKPLHLEDTLGASTKSTPSEDSLAASFYGPHSFDHLLNSHFIKTTNPSPVKGTSFSSPADDDSLSLWTTSSDHGSTASSVKEDLLHEKPNGWGSKKAPTSDFQPPVTPVSPATVESREIQTVELKTVELFAKLDTYSAMGSYFADHLHLLEMQLLDDSRVCHALRAVKDTVDREKHPLLVKLESAMVTNLDLNDTGERLWAFNKLCSKIDEYNLNAHRQKTLLMKARSLYRENRLFVEAEGVLEKTSRIMDSSVFSSDSEDFYEIYARSVSETCAAAVTAYHRLPEWKIPEGLSSAPFALMHRAAHDSRLVQTILRSREYQEALYVRDIIGQSAIHVAAAAGNLQSLTVLISHYLDFDLEERDLLGRTPLFVAASSGKLETSRFLLKRGASHEIRDVARHTMMEICAANGFLETLQLLFEFGASAYPRQYDNTSTPLQAAAEFGHFDVVKYLLDAGRCDVQSKRLEDGTTATDLAKKNGHHGIVELLQSVNQ